MLARVPFKYIMLIRTESCSAINNPIYTIEIRKLIKQ